MGKWFLGLFIALAVILYAGCNREESGKQNTVDINSSGEIRVLSSKDMVSESTYCSTLNGCYLSSFSPEHGGENIFFIDYKARKKVYLSSSVNGDYWSETDTSYLKDGANVSFCADGDKLYAYVLMDSEENQDEIIYQMDLDGQNRKEICRMADNTELVGGMMCDDTYLYFLMKAYKENGLESILCAVDKNGGGIKELYNFEDENQWHFLMSGFDRKLVLKIIEPNENFEKQQHKVVLFDVDTKALTETMTWEQGKIKELNEASSVYYIDVENEKIIRRDLSDGGEEVLWESFPFQYNQGDSISVDGELHDDHLFAYVNDRQYALNVETKEVRELTLRAEGDLFGGSYLSIIGASEDEYLLIPDTGQRKVHWKDHVEGTSGDEVIYYYKYAMIKKEDFYNNRPNYVMIEDMAIDEDSIVS